MAPSYPWRPAIFGMLELSWAAGLFEGEGSVSRAVTHGRPRIRATISQNGDHAPALLERFVAAVGMGKVLGPYDYSGRYEGGLTKKPRYVVQFQNCDDVTTLIERLRPYLSTDSPKLARYEELRAEAVGCKNGG